MASLPVNHSPREGGVACIPVSPSTSEGSVASVCERSLRSLRGGVASMYGFKLWSFLKIEIKHHFLHDFFLNTRLIIVLVLT